LLRKEFRTRALFRSAHGRCRRCGSQENISVEDYSARANLTAKQAEIWNAAQYASTRIKEKFGYDIAPELIYKKWG